MIRRALRAVLVVSSVWLLAGCGPERYPAPRIEEMGTEPAGPSSLHAGARTPAPVARSAPAPAPAPAPRPAAPVAIAPTPTAPAPAPVAQAVPGSEFAFLDAFADRIAAARLGEPQVIAVLPPFHVNTLFQRWEVSRLGEEVAAEVVARLQARRLPDEASLVSPALFERRLGEVNRSLADLDSPDAAVNLALRIGARYLVRGTIEGSNEAVAIRVECIDVIDLLSIASGGATFPAGSAVAQSIHQRFGALGSWRIGALAQATRPSLQAELRLIITGSVNRILVEAGPAVRDLPVAVLATQVPGQIRFQKYQRALERAVGKEKERFTAAGVSESDAMAKGPVRILGTTFRTLKDAEDFARERDVKDRISDTGLLRDTLSRLIFDLLEDLGAEAGVRVIPHDQLVDQAVLFSGEEAEKMREGILSEETKQYFKTKGAGALLFNELIESGDGYEISFQLRRLDDLSRLSGQVREYLEPRFATQLAEMLKGQ